MKNISYRSTCRCDGENFSSTRWADNGSMASDKIFRRSTNPRSSLRPLFQTGLRFSVLLRNRLPIRSRRPIPCPKVFLYLLRPMACNRRRSCVGCDSTTVSRWRLRLSSRSRPASSLRRLPHDAGLLRRGHGLPATVIGHLLHPALARRCFRDE